MRYPSLKQALAFLALCLGALTGACSKSAAPKAAVPAVANAAEANPRQLDGWTLFIPPYEDPGANCRLSRENIPSPSKAPPIAVTSDRPSRFGVRPAEGMIKVKAGDRLKISAWVKLGEGTVIAPETPGVVLRATLIAAGDVDYEKGHYYVGKQKTVFGTLDEAKDIPYAPGDFTEWTQVSGVVDIPAEVVAIKFLVFGWSITGRLYIDEARAVVETAGGK